MRREHARPRLLQRPIAWAVAGASVVAASLIAISVLTSGTAVEAPVTAPLVAQSERDELFRGIPQKGIVLGRPDAPVTLVEYADLQCPYCAQWARDAFPALVDEYVRTGLVRIVFRGLAFIGPDSDKALRAALAAGEQGRLWDVVHGLFAHQGSENAGWVTDALLRGVGGAGLDRERMLASATSAWVEQELQAARTAATAAEVSGTPFFQAGPTGGSLTRVHADSLGPGPFRRELDRLLAA
jgi:protein-disulfide isomerase